MPEDFDQLFEDIRTLITARRDEYQAQARRLDETLQQFSPKPTKRKPGRPVRVPRS